MWILYSVSGLLASNFLINKLRDLYNKLYPTKYKTFEDIPKNDTLSVKTPIQIIGFFLLQNFVSVFFIIVF